MDIISLDQSAFQSAYAITAKSEGRSDWLNIFVFNLVHVSWCFVTVCNNKASRVPKTMTRIIHPNVFGLNCPNGGPQIEWKVNFILFGIFCKMSCTSPIIKQNVIVICKGFKQIQRSSTQSLYSQTWWHSLLAEMRLILKSLSFLNLLCSRIYFCKTLSLLCSSEFLLQLNLPFLKIIVRKLYFYCFLCISLCRKSH